MNAVRGTYDLYGKEMAIHKEIVKNLEEVAIRYGFGQIKTPIIENTELFKRSTGEASDIVQKEMYDFLDKGGRSLTLRPEMTAGSVRAFITNKIYGERLPNYKYFYYGENFRYERPQSLRYRQFYQFGVERFGENDINSDIEILLLANQIIKKFNLENKIILKINTIGSFGERKKYNEKLYEYFQKFQKDLCDDCKARLELNPLKILDCKLDGNKEFVKKAPLLKEYLSTESLNKFDRILKTLEKIGINYDWDPTLVRGLDYYNDMVFEFVYKYEEEEKTIIAGGRYDALIQNLGGPDTPAIGFGIGIERLIEAVKENNDLSDIQNKVDVYYINLDEESYSISLESMEKLRTSGIAAHANFTKRSFKSQIKLAEDSGAVYAVILDREIENTQKVKIKNLFTKEEDIVNLQDFENEITNG